MKLKPSAFVTVLVSAVASVSTADIIVHSSGKIIIHTNVTVNSGSFVVESGGAIDMDLTAKVAATNFNYGGMLTVLPAGSVLTLGERFELFSAPAYSGAFSPLNLPMLDPGLAWINGLGVNGHLYIVKPSQSVFTGISRQAAAMRVQFLGAIGQPYSILATTNVALPLANWSLLGAATETSAGVYLFNDTSFTNFARRYYQVQ